MSRPLTTMTVLALAALAMAGCGKQGALERPAPLFGTNAKAQYEAEQQLEAQRAAEADSRRRDAERAQEADQPDDNGPLLPRDVRDPATRNLPASQAPIPGATAGPFGPPVSVRPAN